DWAVAEEALAPCLQMLRDRPASIFGDQRVAYSEIHIGAHLLKGLAREARGDPAGAQEAYRAGTRQAWLARLPSNVREIHSV
ncbi:hypothetical protein Q8G71_36520, partial [Klebsiella pneumoniae]